MSKIIISFSIGHGITKEQLEQINTDIYLHTGYKGYIVMDDEHANTEKDLNTIKLLLG